MSDGGLGGSQERMYVIVLYASYEAYNIYIVKMATFGDFYNSMFSDERVDANNQVYYLNTKGKYVPLTKYVYGRRRAQALRKLSSAQLWKYFNGIFRKRGLDKSATKERLLNALRGV